MTLGVSLKTVQLLTAKSGVENANFATMLASLEAKFALVSVTDAIVAANGLKFRWASGTFAGGRVSILSANCTPLADL